MSMLRQSLTKIAFATLALLTIYLFLFASTQNVPTQAPIRAADAVMTGVASTAASASDSPQKMVSPVPVDDAMDAPGVSGFARKKGIPGINTHLSSVDCCELTPSGKIIAIADVHGDLLTFLTALKQFGVVDEHNKWAAGDATFVQTGDLVDRGPHSRTIIKLMIQLQEEAAHQGGQVRALWGNHETMQLFGDYRYIHREELNAYEDAISAEEYRSELSALQRYFSSFASLPLRHKRFSVVEKVRVGGQVSAERVAKLYPKGVFGHRKEWGVQGVIGSWLFNPHKHPLTVRVNDTVFVHAGLHHKFTEHDLEELTKLFLSDMRLLMDMVHECTALGFCHPVLGAQHLFHMVANEAAESQAFEHLPPAIAKVFRTVQEIEDREFIVGAESPVWYRGLVFDPENDLQPSFSATLDRYKANTMIVGHTIPDDRKLRKRFAGQFVQLDTGMNQYTYKGAATVGVRMPGSGSWSFKEAKL